MKKINKKILISFLFFFIIILLIFFYIIINNEVNKKILEIDKEKIYYEIRYFDFKIIKMINLLNNIEGNINFYINWKELEKQTESIYSYWNSVILDLNHLDIDKKDLTDFGRNLDQLAISIRNNNKDITLNNLLNLYKKLVIYSTKLDYVNYNKILITKYNLINAYSIVEKENWTLTHEYILKASENFYSILNLTENYKYNQYNINQAYVAVKELENIINIKELSIFYLKYKIAINRLENLTF